MIKALLIGTLISFAYTQQHLFKQTNKAASLNEDDSNACSKQKKPRVADSNNKVIKVIKIPIVKDLDTDETEEQRQQKSIVDSQNCDCSETHKRRCPGHLLGKTTSIVGTWSPLQDTNIKINFDGQDNLTLQGCNINSCGYSLNGRKFLRDEFCLGTKKFCEDDKDPIYLNLLKAAKFVVSGGKDKIVFLDEHLHKILVLFRVVA